jgi:uncharacterized protein YkwD
MVNKKIVLAVTIAAVIAGLSLIPAPTPAAPKGKATLDKAQATAAFKYLNLVRKNPGAHSKEIGVNLSKVAARPQLVWNATLAKVAEQKALDMARRNYFSHTTPEGLGINFMIDRAGYRLPAAWVKPRSANFFESIQAGAGTGKEAIQMLIVDKAIPDLGHRKHLLGMTPFYADCRDAGIGFARASGAKFKTYVSIIIAKRR